MKDKLTDKNIKGLQLDKCTFNVTAMVRVRVLVLSNNCLHDQTTQNCQNQYTTSCGHYTNLFQNEVVISATQRQETLHIHTPSELQKAAGQTTFFCSLVYLGPVVKHVTKRAINIGIDALINEKVSVQIQQQMGWSMLHGA